MNNRRRREVSPPAEQRFAARRRREVSPPAAQGLAARRGLGRPQIDSQVEFANGLPHIVEFFNGRNTEGAGLRQLDLIASTIRISLTDIVRRASGISNTQIARRLRVFLTVENVAEGTEHAAAGELTLADLTGDLLNGLVFRIHQSNRDIDVPDLKWRIVIVPSSIGFGGNQNVRLPQFKIPQAVSETWKPHTYNDKPLNCAAFGLAFLIYKLQNPRGDRSVGLQNTCHLAAWIMKQMAWSEEISINDLEQICRIYPQYKVAVLIGSTGKIIGKFCGQLYTSENAETHSLYLVFDAPQKHFGAMVNVQAFLRSQTNNQRIHWCNACDVKIGGAQDHECENLIVDRKPQPYKCSGCPSKLKGHICPQTKCFTCAKFYPRESYLEHRCLVAKEPLSSYKLKGEPDCDPKKAKAVLVWDTESAQQSVEVNHQMPAEFEIDNQGLYTGKISVYEHRVIKQCPVAVACKDIITGEEWKFIGEDCMKEFGLFAMTYNNGAAIFYAHYSSGYDGRLLFEEALKNDWTGKDPIMRGSKFLQFTLGTGAVFRDSILHLVYSLRDLAKSFNLRLAKSYFPYDFFTLERYRESYIGPLPEKKYFESSLNDPEFHVWHDSFTGDYNMNFEMEKYLMLDVQVLAEIVLKYHQNMMTAHGMSPLFHPTMPSFIHALTLCRVTKDYEIDETMEDKNELRQTLNKIATETGWGVSKWEEYRCLRQALHGGKTNVRQPHVSLEKEMELDPNVDGLWHIDVTSLYPYCSVMFDYPVGTPLIETFDEKYTPCLNHSKAHTIKCGCRNKKVPGYLQHKFQNNQPTTHQLLDFNGIACITWKIPKDQLHTILVIVDENGKCQESLRDEDFIEHWSTSIEIHDCLKLGYEAVQVHQILHYRMAPGLWNNVVWELYLQKMINSRDQPPPEEFEKLVADYTERFGQDVGHLIRATNGKWSNNKIQKQLGKLGVNCGWGKHCQSPFLPQTTRLNHSLETDKPRLDDLFQNLSSGSATFKSAMSVGGDSFLYTFQDNDCNPYIHDLYHPAGLFVPAYGRKVLTDVLLKLGKRAKYFDTDSVVFTHYKPGTGYNPPIDSVLGGWALEHDDIVEFVSTCPKSYAEKFIDGKVAMKMKGLKLGDKTKNLVNFEVLKGQVLGEIGRRFCPQQGMVYKMTKGITIQKTLKSFDFSPETLKGELRPDGYIYPLGHE